jgi:hypothetical protein
VDWLWRLVPPVRTPERGRFVLFVALGLLLTLAQTIGLAGAEALFLAREGAARLPFTFVLASVTTVVASLAYAVRVGRARNDRVQLELLLIGGVSVAGLALALDAGLAAAPTAILCLFFATQAVLVSHFWTFTGDFFDTLAAKRLVSLFTVGMSAGGVLGGALALGLMTRAPAEALIWAWAVGLFATAALVVAAQGRLTHWRALATREEDETSVAGIRAALRHLRSSALGRWLVVSALAMVLALFVAQYLYSEVLAREFPDETALAAFLALYLTASNGVEIVVELLVTPWLIRRVGVPTANLVHPLLTILAFAGLAVDPRLPAAVAARANRELLESALAGPVRNLAYNALPARFRSRMRAFLEGIVIYSGMSLAGVALLAAGRLDVDTLAAVGGGLAVLYLLANVRVRGEYVRAIAAELRAGRIDLRELRAEIGPRELASLAELWTHLVGEETEHPSEALLELAPILAAGGFADVVRNALTHPNARLRAVCLGALAQAPPADGPADPEPWLAALVDPDAIVRRAAVRWLPGSLRDDPLLATRLRARLEDSFPIVRAEAAARLGGEGRRVLAGMLASTDGETVRAALSSLPALVAETGAEEAARPPGADGIAALVAAAAARVADGDPRIRASALEALAGAGAAGVVPWVSLVARASDADASVRRAGVAALRGRSEPEAAAMLADALRDPAREVRSAAVDALAVRGVEGARAARSVLDAAEESAIAAAMRVIGSVRSPETRGWLRASYGARVGEAWEALLLARAFAAGGVAASGGTRVGAAVPPADAVRFLQVACTDAHTRALRLAFRALARLEEESVVRSAQRALRFARGRGQADALEVLSHLGEREASQALAVILERTAVDEKLGALRRLGTPPRGLDDALARARAHPAPWVRAAAAAASDSGSAGATIDAGVPHEATMQRLLALRQISLLSGLSLERLQAVERIVTEAEYVKGEVIMREGEPGDELFLLVEGRVDVLKNAGTPDEVHFNTLGPGAYFGEMAVLDGSPRSATIVAASEVRVVVLAGSRLREIVHDMPEIAFDVFRVLAERLRSAEERVPPERGD